MKITKSTVEKWSIRGIKRMDPINVIFEDFGPGQGKVTIESYGDAWSAYWGAMGRENIKQFIMTASNSYLIGKLKVGISDTIPDESADAIYNKARDHIIKSRKNGDLSREEARTLWDDYVVSITDDGITRNEDALHEIFGPDWWEYGIPYQDNPDWDHLNRIVTVVKDAIKDQE